MGPFLDYNHLFLIIDLGGSHITQGILSTTSHYTSVRTALVMLMQI